MASRSDPPPRRGPHATTLPQSRLGGASRKLWRTQSLAHHPSLPDTSKLTLLKTFLWATTHVKGRLKQLTNLKTMRFQNGPWTRRPPSHFVAKAVSSKTSETFWSAGRGEHFRVFVHFDMLIDGLLDRGRVDPHRILLPKIVVSKTPDSPLTTRCQTPDRPLTNP